MPAEIVVLDPQDFIAEAEQARIKAERRAALRVLLVGGSLAIAAVFGGGLLPTGTRPDVHERAAYPVRVTFEGHRYGQTSDGKWFQLDVP